MPEATAKEIFLKALEWPAGTDRDQFLDSACASDPELRQRIHELFKAHYENSRFLEPQFDGNSTAHAEPPSQSGSLIGPYKLLQKIGEGGMGIVYMAEQTAPVRRKVALKIIKPGMDTKEVIARFEAERQALALMDHPNIARVLGGGVTDAGRPYFVMDLVHGTPLNTFCDQTRMTTQQRLELFLDVCRAVQHAHQKGIIHRDLKPTNVLVTMDDVRPVPKVIDFGVAKALSQQLTDKTLFTAYGQMIGTPLYMSPEQTQYSAQDIDTRSDIYSLGVLLYELLTGNTPFDKETLQKSGYEGMRKLICEVDPPRPSHRVATLNQAARTTVADQRNADPRKLQDSLKGELDWIVMKTLEKDRNRRYDTVNGLAADIQRYLNNEPVHACPPSTVYRARKFISRNKARLTMATIVVVAALLVTIVMVQGRFEAQRRDMEAVQSVQSLLASAETAISSGNLDLAKEKLVEARGQLNLVALAGGNLEQELVTLEGKISQARQDEATFAKFVEQARNVHDTWIYGGGIDNIKLALGEAKDALQLYGVLDRNDWFTDLKNSQLSEQQQNQVRETAYETLLLLAYANENLKELRSDSAVKEGLTYLEIASRFHEPTKAFFWVRKSLYAHLKNSDAAARDRDEYESMPAVTAWDWYLHGSTTRWRGDPSREIPAYKEALRVQPDHFNSLFFLAERLTADNRTAEALGYYSACLALRSDHLWTYFRRAAALKKIGQNDEAELDYKTAIRVSKTPGHRLYAYKNLLDFYKATQQEEKFQQSLDEAIAEYPKSDQHDLWSAVSLKNIGNLLRMANRLDEAIACHQRAVQIAEDQGMIDKDRAVLQHDLGMALKNAGQLDEAIIMLRKALASDPNHATILSSLGSALCTAGKYDEGMSYLKKAVEIAPHDPFVLNHLGNHLHSSGKPDEALAYFQRALEYGSKTDSRNLASFNGNMASALRDAGRPEEAIPFMEKGLQLDPNNVLMLEYLGLVLKDLGRLDEAITRFRTAVALAPDDFYGLLLLGSALQEAGKRDEAIEYFQRAKQLSPKTGKSEPHYRLALGYLASSDLAVYQKACREMCAALATTTDARDAYFTAVTCALGAGALEDYEPAIQLARRALEQKPDSQQYRNGLGAILMRAGRYEEAREMLQQALQAPADAKTSTAFIYYFLALTEFHLGNLARAQEHLQAANQDAASQLNNPTAPWNRKVTLKLLKQEAESLLGVTAPIEADSLRPPAPELPVRPSP